MSEFNPNQLPDEILEPPRTGAQTSHNTNSADTTTNNDDIVNKLFDEKLQLNDNQTPSDSPPSDEEFSDTQPEAIDAESYAEATRRRNEQYLTDEQLAENEARANEIKTLGNEQFKKEDYWASLELYSEGLDVCPLASTQQRAILLGNRSAVYVQLGKTESALADINKALDINPHYTKVLLRRAKLYEQTDKLDESLVDFKRVVEMNPDCADAQMALVRLPRKIAERNEKLKDEMLGKLKDLGNVILKPFGLSTNNFQMKQDPSTGSYSVNFNQNQ